MANRQFLARSYSNATVANLLKSPFPINQNIKPIDTLFLKNNSIATTMDTEALMELAGDFLRVTVAMSPLIIIGLILATAREDEEEEKAKLEAAKKADSCKT